MQREHTENTFYVALRGQGAWAMLYYALAGLINCYLLEGAPFLWYPIIYTATFGIRQIYNKPPFSRLTFWNYTETANLHLGDRDWGEGACKPA